MGYTDKQISALIVDYLNNIIEKNEISDDNKDSLNVAIDCITDVFSFDRDNLSDLISNDDRLIELLNKKSDVSAPASSTTNNVENVEVNISADDAEVKAKAENSKLEGNKALASKNFDLAIEKYTEAISVLPTNPIYYANRAAAYTNLQDFDNAVKDAEAAIKIDPTYSKGYSRLAYAKYVQDKPEEAVEAYKKVLELEGDKATEVTKRGYEIAKNKLAESLNANKSNDSIEKSNPTTAEEPTDTNTNAGGFDFASMLGGGLGNGLGSLLNNPQVMQAAQQMMQDPNAMQKMQDMMSNPSMQEMAQKFASGNTNMGDLMNDPSVKDMASKFFNK